MWRLALSVLCSPPSPGNALPLCGGGGGGALGGGGAWGLEGTWEGRGPGRRRRSGEWRGPGRRRGLEGEGAPTPEGAPLRVPELQGGQPLLMPWKEGQQRQLSGVRVRLQPLEDPAHLTSRFSPKPVLPATGPSMAGHPGGAGHPNDGLSAAQVVHSKPRLQAQGLGPGEETTRGGKIRDPGPGSLLLTWQKGVKAVAGMKVDSWLISRWGDRPAPSRWAQRNLKGPHRGGGRQEGQRIREGNWRPEVEEGPRAEGCRHL